MQFTIPKVFHIAQTNTDISGMGEYLTCLGAGNWQTDAESSAEKLIEVAGRRCYKSFDVSLNPNLTKIREGNFDYITNIVKVGHGSVVEHAYDTFAFEDVSRVFTHEAVRHRLCNFSQESLRFVRPTQLKTLYPQVFIDNLTPEQNDKLRTLFETTFTHLEDIQKALIEIIGMDALKDFNLKKLFQSANRRLMPDGMLTGIIITANHRSWRHMIAMRTSIHAEEEIRFAFNRVALYMRESYPALYADMHALREDRIYGEQVSEWTFKHLKI